MGVARFKQAFQRNDPLTMGSANTGADLLYTERGKAAIQALFESDILYYRLS